MTQHRFRALIMDMDGVLVDSEPVHGRAWECVLTALGAPCEPGWFLSWIGVPDDALADRLVASGAVPLAKSELLRRKRETYNARVLEEMRAFPGVKDALRELNGTPCAVATSSGRDSARLALGLAGLLPYFAAMVCWEDVARHKPAPDPYVRAAQLLGVPPRDCAAVEDSPAGIASAKAAGCVALAVKTSYPHERLVAADYVFETPRDALDWLRPRLAVATGPTETPRPENA
ncbi:MAG TPA: HAD family phosphatase [Candidatus Hydrogenedentes bacterium]|nr:HAD family phosphatase [Candidatus Hydrogenedentota bacterium]